MKIRGFFFLVLLITFTPSLKAQHQHELSQQEDETVNGCSGVMLIDGWARATVAGAPNGAAYGYVINLGDEPDRLTGGRTPAASTVEIHTMIMDGDVMRMRPLEDGLEIPASGFVKLAPGGFHIMLINLAEPLETDSTLDLTLTFENAGDIALTLPIRELDVTTMGAMAHESAEMSGMGSHEASSEDLQMDEQCQMMYEGVHLLGGWARPAPEGTPTSAVYGLMVNLTDTGKTLVSIETSAAEAVEIHQTTVDEDDVMRMRPVEDGLALPLNQGVELKTGRLHLMLINPTLELLAGETIELVLTFDDDSTATIMVPIVDPSMEDGDGNIVGHGHSN